MELNLIPFVVEALGSNKLIYKDIDNLYQQYKYEFYKAAKEHELYNHKILKEGSLLQEEYCKKVLGILAAGVDESDYQDFMKIMEKGFSWTYSYIQNRFTIDPKDYLNAFQRKFHGPIDDKGIGIEFHFTILLFLALNMKKKIIEDEPLQQHLQLLQLRLNHTSEEDETRLTYEKQKPETIGRIQKLKQDIFKKYGKIRNFDDLVAKELDGTKKDMFAFLFDFENISSISIFRDIKFTDRDIDEILCLYTIIREDEELDVDEALNFLIPCIYIKYLIKAYKQVKEMYFRNNKETMFVELEGMEKDLQRMKEKLESTQRVY